VVEVLEREPGTIPPYEEVRAAVRQALERHAYATALRQYVEVLAGQARLEGVDLDAAISPLVQ
jgi:peptidyl-prolyl cis-trans isomerase C